MPSLILGVTGISVLNLNVRSRAVRASGAGPCIYVLSKNTSQALLMNSGATVEAPACGVHVHSTANPAAVLNAGTTMDTSEVCIAGSSILDNGGTYPTLATNCAVVSSPFSGMWPAPASSTCGYNNMNYSGASVTLSPGVYCGYTNFNAGVNVVLTPGIYVIKGGGWNVNGGVWTGNGVTFYFPDTSRIQFNSAVDADLKAPTNGVYEGVLMFEASDLATSPFVIDDSLGFSMEGIIALPSRDMTFNSNANLEAKKFSLAVNTLILNNVNWELESFASGRGGPADIYLAN